MSRLAVMFRSFAFPAVIAVTIFASAGKWDLPLVWAVLGVMAGFYLVLAAFADPDMMRERAAPGSGNRDRLTGPLGGVLLVAHWVVVGLDVGRFRWSLVPWGFQV